MEQISLPFRIAFLSIALLGAVWFVALRPKTSSTPSQAPGVAGLSHAVDAAHGAAAASDANAAAAQAAANAQTGSTPAATGNGSTPIAKVPAKPGKTVVHKASADLSAPILAQLTKGRVAVIAFAGSVAGDDRAVRRALGDLDMHHGKLIVRAVEIADVADYPAITRGVQVVQSPTVLVIGHDRKAHSIVGFTDSHEIDQLVDDVGGKGF